MPITAPGQVVLLGSGETLPSSGKIHEYIARLLPDNPHIVILETPAGFELNSDLVAGRIKNFLTRRLQNYQPAIEVLPARRRGTPFSPDNPGIVAPILKADEILLGPGSPTYGARQLQDSLALHMITARQRRGGILFLSSSAPISFGAYTLPVYEIYKAGLDLHWVPGLNFFGAYGLELTCVSHWNNNDGGEELDTSRCYIGQERFNQLLNLLPPGQTIVGIDEHTALILDFMEGHCRVQGNDSITILRSGKTQVFQSGDHFPLDILGEWHVPEGHSGIPDPVWEAAQQAEAERRSESQHERKPSPEILSLVRARDKARDARDWTSADALRDQIATLGWQIDDTPQGSQLTPIEDG
ncbi:MAG: cysteinyl-tRNA synthetase [Anaerolineales bacterium]|jgi:hypothetical protein